MFTLLFFLIALLSEIVGTVAGFGSSVFFVPLAGFFFDFHQVLGLTSILHVFSNAAKLVFFGRHIRLGLLLLLGVPSVAAVIAGAYLSTKLTFKFDELVLGLFLMPSACSWSASRALRSPLRNLMRSALEESPAFWRVSSARVERFAVLHWQPST